MSCSISVTRKVRGYPKTTTDSILNLTTKSNSTIVTGVFKHVSGCNRCDPNKILSAYIDNRDGGRYRGKTAGWLVKLAFRFETLPRFSNKGLVDEILVRSNSMMALSRHGNRLSEVDFARSLLLIFQSVWNFRSDYAVETFLKKSRHYGLAKTCSRLWNSVGQFDPHDPEIRKYGLVLGVLES